MRQYRRRTASPSSRIYGRSFSQKARGDTRQAPSPHCRRTSVSLSAHSGCAFGNAARFGALPKAFGLAHRAPGGCNRRPNGAAPIRKYWLFTSRPQRSRFLWEATLGATTTSADRPAPPARPCPRSTSGPLRVERGTDANGEHGEVDFALSSIPPRSPDAIFGQIRLPRVSLGRHWCAPAIPLGVAARLTARICWIAVDLGRLLPIGAPGVWTMYSSIPDGAALMVPGNNLWRSDEEHGHAKHFLTFLPRELIYWKSAPDAGILKLACTLVAPDSGNHVAHPVRVFQPCCASA